LIGQLHYETTSKYNFPLILRETGFSRKIMELSLNTMHTIKGRPFQLDNVEFSEPFLNGAHDKDLATLKGRMISTLLTPLRPIRDGTPITGIDVSSIKVGTTDAGAVYAVRGAIVMNANKKYRYLRFGPFPFHITRRSLHEMSSEIKKDLTLSLSTLTQVEPQTQLCSLIERWLQSCVSYLAKEGIILWDGSLTAGISGSPAGEVSEILKAARENSNIVMGFSKDTTLRFLDWKITDLVNGYRPPCLFELDSLPLSSSAATRLLGRIYVAKLARRGCAFRLDVDRSISREESIIAVERLLGNELLYQGYPETLRLAHIYSTFTATDVIGIQRFLIKKYGLRLVSKRNMHRTLFGPYGVRMGD
jgi:hypothetical protein